MEFGKTKLEFKLGLFVLFGIIILTAFILLIGDFKSLGVRYKVNCVFNFVNGIKIGAPVRFAGVDVGEVKALDFMFIPEENKTKIKVGCLIERQLKIPADSKIWVNTLGLLGEKYIEIIPGSDYANFIPPNGSIAGKDPVAMEEVGEMARNIALEFRDTLAKIKNGEGTIGRLFYDDALYKELEDLVSDIKLHPWKLFFKGKEKPVSKSK
ncbi:MAG: MlaD family protein [Candidatus Omnitrophica bacterium]|nr:MlaD family protein [Candidatus Omnitrophota bacterium]